MLYVSTLDGKISALDMLKGEQKWSIPTTPSAMISSSIQNLELTNNGQWVRMIPSLSGSLYKFDGEGVEPIPMNADNLLSSSFKFSDDLVISGTNLIINCYRIECNYFHAFLLLSFHTGGKETISYGISAHSGRVIYECSMHGCTNSTDLDPNDDDSINSTTDEEIVVVRRQTQTVRAIEPRTGGERWNFSVGQHELELVRSPDDCHPSTAANEVIHDFEFKFIVPEGIVYAVRRDTPHIVEWKHKMDFPIVNAWQRDENHQLKSIDLFATAQAMWQQSERYKPMTDDGIDGTGERLVPSIYIGMYNKQLYIQESDRLRLTKANLVNHLIRSETKSFARIPWRPIEASSTALTAVGQQTNAIVPSQSEDTGIVAIPNHQVMATSVLYASEYVNGNGFYLLARENQFNVSKNDGNDKMCKKDNETSGKEMTELDGSNGDADEDTMPPVNIVSLWYWWKEIMVISLTTALALNVVLSQRKNGDPEVVIVERHVEIKVPSTPDASDEVPSISNKRSTSESCTTGGEGESSDGWDKSRFQTDFDMVQCLGKGGYGVVFEVKNKLDGCQYAIKRIAMPKSQTKHDSVIREVKTLATCDHQNIVRYFNSWVEKPPPGWQEREDRLWMEREALSHSVYTDSVATADTSHLEHVHNSAIAKNDLGSIISNLKTNECVNFDDELRKTNFRKQHVVNGGNDNNDDDDSFIQFDRSGNEDLVKWNSHDEDGSEDESNPVFSKQRNTETMHSKHTDAKNPNNIWIILGKGSATSGVCSGAQKPTYRRPMSLDLNVPVPRWYLYIQMQLCRKESLKDWLQKNDLNVRTKQTFTIFKQIVEAVEYVHLKGLIHRDLKPGNIFFSLDGQVKIGDFGLVTDMLDERKVQTPCGDETGLPSLTCTQHTEQVGTHLYMSPEQLCGGPYNYKVDIYSLGLIFFELLVVFGTEMERIETLRSLRSSHFPSDFQKNYKHEVRESSSLL